MSNENAPSSSQVQSPGLLSKVVKFVSNPTKDWKELDALAQPVAEEDVNAQQLRERIERKRRNDFIRKAEFAHLRKIINARKKQRHPSISASVLAKLGSVKPAADEVKSVVPAAMKSRSGTLQKINEIEAQLSKQWWQAGREGGATELDGNASGEVSDADAVSDFFIPDANLFFADAVDAKMRAGRKRLYEQAEDASNDDELLEMLRHMDEVLVFFGYQEEFVHQADLEEAAILFASHRVSEAEKVLVDVIRKHASDSPQNQVDIWMALFDLYRSVGVQDRFDTVALDFAKRFEQSAPVWFSIPEQLGTSQAVAENRRSFSWTSSPDLTVHSVTNAAALCERAAAPYHLNWSRLKSIADDAIEPLIVWLDKLSAQAEQVEFSGTKVLLAYVAEKTVAGDTTVSRTWWSLRMALLRLMNAAEEFELAALDYTVTYEESPPAWRPPQAIFSDADQEKSTGIAVSQPAADAEKFVMEQAVMQGRIDNDATDVLEAAVASLAPNAPVTIDCSKLIAVDFAAAGSILNWAAQQQNDGRVVVFKDLHRLVAVFFNVIGINDHARVVPRKN